MIALTFFGHMLKFRKQKYFFTDCDQFEEYSMNMKWTM